MKKLLSALIILTSTSSYAGGSRKLVDLCKDLNLNQAVKITRSGTWDIFNTVPEKIELYNISDDGQLKKTKKERLYSDDGNAVTTWNVEINEQEYSMMWESKSYKYYIGLKSDSGNNYNKSFLFNKDTQDGRPFNCN